MINLSSFIRFHAIRTPERPALVYGEDRISYRAFYERIEKVGGWLIAQGITPGDVVALLMKNSTAFLELSFAISHIGAIALPINFRLVGEEVRYIVDNAEAKLLIADEEFAGSVTGLQRVALLDREAQRDASILAGDARPAAMAARAPSDLFRLMYTSGTTARPKGVTHTYENFYWKSSEHVVTLGLGSETRLLVVGPLYHVGAFDLPGVAVLWAGGMLCIHRDFEPAAVLRSIEQECITGAWLAPVMTTSVLVHLEKEAFDVSSLRWTIGGGERTPEARIRAFSQHFPNARYVDAYGLTETCSGDTFMEAGREIEKIGSVGRATPHVEIEIRDEAGESLRAGEAGEICLRGPKITKEYWRDPERTAAAFHRNGWFRSGDVGYLDTDGFLYLTDRMKDMIISGGENIASSEVERVVLELPHVREVAVVGLPDERWGEKPAAYVVLSAGTELTLEQLTAHCRAKLAGFKVPKALFVRDSLPRNPSGKILKRVLREEVR